MTEPTLGLTQGTLLDGRLRYAQFAAGYRTGIEPVLLAAAVPARAGDRVLEAGSGAGAGLLCLAARVPNLLGIGVEQNQSLASLAEANAAANGYAESLRFIAARIETITPASLGGAVQHAMANPPWHSPRGTLAANAGRQQAKQAYPGLLTNWVAALAACLKPRGTLSLILPAASLAEAIGACAENKLGSLFIHPFWPRPGLPAKLVLLRGVRLGRGATTLHAGLVLHTGTRGFSPAAEAVLRQGEALPS